MKFVIAKERGTWFVNGIIEEVETGDIVAFTDNRDADHFINDDRAEEISEDEAAAAILEDKGDDDMAMKAKLENKAAMRTDSAKAAPVKKPAAKKTAKKTAKKIS